MLFLELPKWPSDFKIREYPIDNPPQRVGQPRSDKDWECQDLSRFSSKFFYQYFRKPYFCIKKKKGKTMPQIQFSSVNITSKRCIRIVEPTDYTWQSPFLCVPHNSWYKFSWENQGVHGSTNSRCLKWKLPKGSKEGWCNNLLCAQEKSDGKGKASMIN